MDNKNSPFQFGNTEQSLLLPDETIEEILSRLPVKSLLRFRCVSKQWRSLIGSDRFIKIQFENSTKNTSLAHHRVILNRYGCLLKQCSLQPLLNEPSLDPSPIYDPTDNRHMTGYVVGCCNGVVCIRKLGRFFLWNPATRISVELPESRGGIPTNLFVREILDANRDSRDCGFGWDEASGAYKVITVECVGNKRICKVYSSNINSWKTILEDTDFSFLYGKGQFLGGKLHWLRVTEGSDAIGIATFDLKSEAFGMMELPCDPMSWFGFWFSVVGGFLSFVYTDRKVIGMWVMKQYGVKDSWEKVMFIPLVCGFYGTTVPFVAPLYLGLNGEILLLYQSTFLVYNPDENGFSLAMEIVDSHTEATAFVYVESLASPVLHKNLGATC